MAVTKSKGGNLSVEIKGYNRVRNSMRELITLHPEKVDNVMRFWAEDMRMFLKRRGYPSRPKPSSYRRTGRLASSWKKVKVKPAVWAFTNDAKAPRGQFYARYVVGEKDGPGDKRQAKVHRNIWWNADVEVEKEVPVLTARLTERILEIWNE